MSKLSTLDEKFTHDLGDIYDAEHRFLEAQQEMLEQASDAQLKKMIKAHIKQTQVQIGRLEEIHASLGKKAKRIKCAAAAGLVSEGQKGMSDSEENPRVRDCVIASAAAKVEHYEIASYRGLISGAESMGHTEVVELLRENLAEEEETAELVETSVPTLLQKASKGRPGAAAAPKKSRKAPLEAAESPEE